MAEGIQLATIEELERLCMNFKEKLQLQEKLLSSILKL